MLPWMRSLRTKFGSMAGTLGRVLCGAGGRLAPMAESCLAGAIFPIALCTASRGAVHVAAEE